MTGKGVGNMTYSKRVFGYDADDLRGTLEAFREHGVTSVVGGASPDAISFFTGNGIDYYVAQGCFFTDETTDSPENLCVDIEGNVTKWFGSACPNSPAAVEKCMHEAERLAGLRGISGIIIDGARFASPESEEGENAFFTCFCGNCTAKMALLGYSPDEISTAVAALHAHCKTGHGYDPHAHGRGIEAWGSFRRAVITDHLKNYVRIIKGAAPSLKTGMYIFAPSLSDLVGQSYADLPGVFDFLSPMLYRRFDAPVGTACLDHELAALLKPAELLTDAEKRPILDLYGGLTGIDFRALPPIGELEREGCPLTIVEGEIRKAKDMAAGKAAIIPIFMLDDEHRDRCVRVCLENGIGTVDFFRYSSRDGFSL